MDTNDIFRILMIQNMNYLNSMDPLKITIFSALYMLYTLSSKYLSENPITFYSTYFHLINGTIFKRKNELILEGIRATTPSFFSGNLKIDTIFSNSFKAVLDYILKNPDNFDVKVIKILSETKFENEDEETSCDQSRKFHSMVEDVHPILIDKEKEIYVEFSKEVKYKESNKNNNSNSVELEYIDIIVYSYVTSLSEIKDYINNLTENYMSSISEYRKNKIFVYTMTSSEKKGETENTSKDYDWQEDVFESSKTFANTFFENKKQVLDKIDFFINNKNWYYEYGIPYTLGIGLHGPPGTGKTSFIKALANYTKRHVVCISLKDIKTRTDLESVFFENTYNYHYNREGSVGFDQKIIVFEDIDCVGDIVIDRSLKEKTQKPPEVTAPNNSTIVLNNGIDLEKTLIKCAIDKPQITLDDILNLWDGIRENTGRIMIISSNQYEKLDNALIRPGRIDITLNMANASHETISDMYEHLYKKPIDKKQLNKIKEGLYSPAELINYYVKYNDNPEKFLERVAKNKK